MQKSKGWYVKNCHTHILYIEEQLFMIAEKLNKQNGKDDVIRFLVTKIGSTGSEKPPSFFCNGWLSDSCM